uniref:Uncharacterized protein n=1 Tax=Rhizophora mucronata TaxID=61149 RepID=A0A2P2NDK7_RHIMU
MHILYSHATYVPLVSFLINITFPTKTLLDLIAQSIIFV